MTDQLVRDHGPSAVTEKRCPTCGETKASNEFHRSARRADGLASQCKRCACEQKREYRHTNRELIAKRQHDYYRANRERVSERNREYNQANRKQIVEQRREYREANHDLIRDRDREYRFGITGAQYDALLAVQSGSCAGCGVTRCKSGRAFAVDHDHGCCPPTRGSMTHGACGHCVRGLVCMRCNFTDMLAGQPYVDWTAVMGATQTEEAA